MSRYSLGRVASFDEVTVGWDEGPQFFFLQCTPIGDDPEEAPAVWIPIVRSLSELDHRLATLNITMPDGVRRMLQQDAGLPVEKVLLEGGAASLTEDFDIAALLAALPDDLDAGTPRTASRSNRGLWTRFRALVRRIIDALRRMIGRTPFDEDALKAP